MHSEITVRLALAAMAVLLTSACAPRFYERETVSLNHRDLDQFEIRYEEFEGCLLKRPVPVNYRVKRQLYTMTLDVHFGTNDTAAGLDVILSGGGNLAARFPELDPQPVGSTSEAGERYRIDTAAAGDGPLTITVLRDATTIGQEVLQLKRERCRALSVGD